MQRGAQNDGMGGERGPTERFMAISPADFFYRNRDLAGFSNPSRAVYSAIRELVENSLDACESYGIPPEIYVRLIQRDGSDEKGAIYEIRVADNGSGVPPEHVPSAFGQILYGSKYTLRQVRGTFGLGGKMAILYGQITTHSSAHIVTSTGKDEVYEFDVAIDIQRNEPNVIRHGKVDNTTGWRGTIVEFSFEGDYTRAMPKIIEYFRQTVMVCPYANITFVEPKGRLYRFDRVTEALPLPPKESQPHPYGIDVETLHRIISVTDCGDLHGFMAKHFQRVGRSTAEKFLKYAGFEEKGDPRKLEPSDIVSLVQAMKSFDGFLIPDASCLSPVGEELLRAGIVKELKPEFVEVVQMKPHAYSGYPFIVEVGVAYGGGVPSTPGITLYRFANRIPLLYDEASDVTRKIINDSSKMNWRYYKVAPEMPVALFVHICSTKIPYKTVGKEYIADRPEVEEVILRGVREVARRLRRFLSRKMSIEHERRRIGVFSRYLPKIARFSAELAGMEKTPDIEPLLRSLRSYGEKEE